MPIFQAGNQVPRSHSIQGRCQARPLEDSENSGLAYSAEHHGCTRVCQLCRILPSLYYGIRKTGPSAHRSDARISAERCNNCMDSEGRRCISKDQESLDVTALPYSL